MGPFSFNFIIYTRIHIQMSRTHISIQPITWPSFIYNLVDSQPNPGPPDWLKTRYPDVDD